MEKKGHDGMNQLHPRNILHITASSLAEIFSSCYHTLEDSSCMFVCTFPKATWHYKCFFIAQHLSTHVHIPNILHVVSITWVMACIIKVCAYLSSLKPLTMQACHWITPLIVTTAILWRSTHRGEVIHGSKWKAYISVQNISSIPSIISTR